MKKQSSKSLLLAILAIVVVGIGLVPLDVSAARGGGHARTSVHRSSAANVNRHANINRNTNVNRNINRSTNVDINRDIDVDIDVDRRWNHPVGAAIAVGATAAVIGSIVYSLPPSCSMVQIGNVTYQQCGSVWYRPQYVGTSIQYVVVESPY